MSPDGKLLAAPEGGLDDHGRPCRVMVWDARTGQEVFALKGHDGGVLTAVFSPDGGRLATAGNDGTLRVWDMATGVELCDMRHRQGRNKSGPTGYQLLYACFSPDGTHLASAGWDGRVNVWDIDARKEVLSFPANDSDRRYVYSVAYSPDGKALLSSGDDGNIVLWDAGTGAKVLVLQKGGTISYHAIFSRDGRRIATAHKDGTARVWDSRDGTKVAATSGHGTVTMYDAGSVEKSKSWTANVPGANRIDFSADDSRLALANSDGRTIIVVIVYRLHAQIKPGPVVVRILMTGS